MTDLRKAAQDVVDHYDTVTVDSAIFYETYVEALRSALQAEPEPVGAICLTPKAFNIGANIFDCTIQFELGHTPKQGDELYTAPPSLPKTKQDVIDEMIVDAVKDATEKQHCVDALIAEIEAVGVNNHMAIQAILDKYRSAPTPPAPDKQ